ncbi:hypothetical protein DAPPUDRAFT_105078 [Daphnia pulex]|uniref:Uncharacterized protein n=1 Tax=Daphnia pulex TaxID=6669 RepID=E9GPC7_DAPPU|nr:hypothetical protein DAPPUDRAFT_105078 [Daphnia pulex]|eukprot:EFX78618.1 hypothetical protein DAPPUDRAFT_105078 [Daphnia pulex]
MSASKPQRESVDRRPRAAHSFYGIWEEGMCQMRECDQQMDTPIPPRVLFTLQEMREKVLNSPHFMWSQERFSVSPPKYHKDLSSSATSSFDSCVPQYDSTEEEDTSDSESTSDASLYWDSKNLGDERDANDDDPRSRGNSRSSGRTTAELPSDHAPFLLVPHLNCVKTEPYELPDVVLHSFRPASSVPSNYSQRNEFDPLSNSCMLVLLCFWGMFLTFMWSYVAYDVVQKFHMNPEVISFPIDSFSLQNQQTNNNSLDQFLPQ